MIGGAALSARALSDAARRDLASEWGGAEPGAARRPEQTVRIVRDAGRRAIVGRP